MEIKRIDKIKSKRKKEEKQKFIYKNTMKGLKNKLKLKTFTQKKVLKKIISQRFYEEYFDNISESQKKEIENYHMTPKNKSSFNLVSKSLNRKYFCAIFAIQKLKKAFFGYLTDEFARNYQDKIANKIKNFIRVNLVDSEKNKKADIAMLCKEIIKNPKWKIPWTIQEVRFAVEEFEAEFKNLN